MSPIRFLAPAAVVLAGLLAYSSAFPGAFVFDDTPNISRNPQLDRPLDYLPGGPGYSAQPGRAVTFATFALDRAVAGNAPTFHRAVNVAIHILGALLVLALTLAAFQAPRLKGSALAPQVWAVGLVAGLLFVAHPIQTQAVTYIVQRLASLATLFYLLAALLYVRWRNAGEARSRGWAARATYAGALLAAVLAMRSKEIIPFAAAAALIPATLLTTSAPAGAILGDPSDATRVQTAMSRGDYLLTQFTVIASYLGLIVFPAGQTIDHDLPVRHSFADPAVLGSAALLLAVAAGAAWLLFASSPRRPLSTRRHASPPLESPGSSSHCRWNRASSPSSM
jgi:hypothetical protein